MSKPARIILIFLLCVLLLSLSLLTPQPARAQGGGVTLDAAAGLDSYCKYNRWFPVRVTLANTGAGVDGLLVATTREGSAKSEYSAEVSLPTASKKEITLYVYPRGQSETVEIAYVADGAILATAQKDLLCQPETDYLHAVWAASPSAFNPLTSVDPSGGRASLAELSSADLPDRFQGLAMLDTLAISDVDTGVLSEAQRIALRAWITTGGRLIVAGGTSWQKTAAGLGDLLPLTPTGSQTLPGVSALREYAGNDSPLDETAVVATGELNPGADVIVSQDEIPLIITQQIGYGEVIYFAADPALAPLRNWDGTEDLYAKLLLNVPDKPGWAAGFTDPYAAETALAEVPGLAIPSPWLICGFLMLYVAVIGPLNYLVLRALKIREMAWVSIPILTILFTGAAIILGAGIRGSRPIVNQLSVVQVWPGEEYAVVNSLLGVFSPQRESYEFAMDGLVLASPLPNLGFAPTEEDWYARQDDAGFRIPEMQVDVGGISGNVISGLIPAPKISQSLQLDVSENGFLEITGDVTNESDLRLDDAFLLGPGVAVGVGDFIPGQTLPVSLGLGVGGYTAPSYSGGLINDNTLNDLFTTYTSSAFNDPDDNRRYNLISAALGSGRGSNVFLVGWATDPLLEGRLDHARARYEHTTFVVIRLTPAGLADATGLINITPSLLNWRVRDTTISTPVSPYGVSTYESGSYTLEFFLPSTVAFTTVEGLTLHLSSFGSTGSALITVQLWDFENENWRRIADPIWGANPIPNPAAHVGPNREIRLQIGTLPGQTQLEIESSVFSLLISR